MAGVHQEFGAKIIEIKVAKTKLQLTLIFCDNFTMHLSSLIRYGFYSNGKTLH